MGPAKVSGYAVAAIVLGVGVVALLGAIVLFSGGGDDGSDFGAAQRTTPAGKAPVRESTRLFAASSFWNEPLEDDAEIDRTSAPLVKELSQEARREVKQGNGPWIASEDGTASVYEVDRDVPVTRVALDRTNSAGEDGLRRAFRAVPIPRGARPARGPDGHMVVWQPSTDRMWEFFKMRRTARGWQAKWGGAMQNVSRDEGVYTQGSWPQATPNWGATATSLPLAGGLITLSDLRRGSIDHALALNLPAPRQGVFSWPAQRSDGTGPASALPEGARLRLDPDVDIAALKLDPLTRMIATAAQRHGFVVRDQTHSGMSLFAEDVSAHGENPFYGERGLYGDRTPSQLLAEFPWERLQVLRMTLCRDAPCVERPS